MCVDRTSWTADFFSTTLKMIIFKNAGRAFYEPCILQYKRAAEDCVKMPYRKDEKSVNQGFVVRQAAKTERKVSAIFAGSCGTLKNPWKWPSGLMSMTSPV